MDATLQALMSSGRSLLVDTKQRKPAPGKLPTKSKFTIAEAAADTESDPHRLFIRKVIHEKYPKDKIVEEFKKFIKAAEEAL